jgi:drug/metabolite transporter (DMT)-like permease
MLGLVCLYHGLANGRSSVVAPVSTIIAQAVPVLYVAFSSGLPKLTQLIGFVLAILGVFMVSRAPESLGTDAPRSSGLLMALLAGLGFGLFFVFVGFTEAAHVFGSLAVARVATVSGCLLLLLARSQRLSRAAAQPAAALSGALDAIGNALYLVAKQYVRQDVAVVLSSLYPVSTILLSFFFFKERIMLIQWAGIGVCALAVTLIVT